MTSARSKSVDPKISRWYHCFSRCVRQAFLLRQGDKRKQWIEDRLREVVQAFAVSVGSFAILDNHFHLLLRLDPAVAAGWSAEEVVSKWAQLHPPRHKRKVVPITAEWLAEEVKNTERVEMLRSRLCSLGWFMKEVKEPLARLANREDGCKGAFFEGRYKSIALLDEQSLLAVSAYIDLNPVAAGIAQMPESSPFTALNRRILHVASLGREADLAKALESNVAAQLASAGLEDNLWLVPIEDRRRFGASVEGMLEGFTLGNYLMLVEFTHQARRSEYSSSQKRVDSSIFDRLGIDPNSWLDQEKRLTTGNWFGRFLASTRQALRDAASGFGLHHCVNLNGCTAE